MDILDWCLTKFTNLYLFSYRDAAAVVRLGQDTLQSNVGWRYSVVSTDASKEEVLGLLQISGSWLDHRSQVGGGRKALRQTTCLWLIHTVSKSILTCLPETSLEKYCRIPTDSSYPCSYSVPRNPQVFVNVQTLCCQWISNNSHWAKTKYWMCKCCWHMYPIPLLCLYYIFKVCVNAVCSLVKNAPLFLLLNQTGGMTMTSVWNYNEINCSTSCLIQFSIRVIFIFI